VIKIGFWFIIQVLNGLTTLGGQSTGNVAWFAHIGDFVRGALLICLFPKKDTERPPGFEICIQFNPLFIPKPPFNCRSVQFHRLY